ncbi:hypothetical protein Taro_004902 [Colocasia esculenta]|uniref:Uncharacterized protein n=1 Tax=Colocasia esculenta TaxID=4460 RepID=A0A843TNK7_COLES|nr:hypothetical protein [Colocasia esculenta]
MKELHLQKSIHNFYSSSLYTCKLFDKLYFCHDICTLDSITHYQKYLSSNSMLAIPQPRIIGEEHYETTQKELFEGGLFNDPFLSQSFFVAQLFTCSPRKFVGLAKTTRELDNLPKKSFYLVGNIDGRKL